jgi:hypothetical protein
MLLLIILLMMLEEVVIRSKCRVLVVNAHSARITEGQHKVRFERYGAIRNINQTCVVFDTSRPDRIQVVECTFCEFNESLAICDTTFRVDD